MKTCISRYKNHIMGLLLAASATLFLAGTNDPQPAFRLEGAWTCNVSTGPLALFTFTPSPSGKASVDHGQLVWPPGMLERYGLSGTTDYFGETVMTGKNTAEFVGRWYGLVEGRPVVVFVMRGTATLVSSTELSNVSTTRMYYADAAGEPVGDPIGESAATAIARRIAW